MNSTAQSDLPTEEICEPSTQQTKVEPAVRSLRTLLEGDEQEQRETFACLKQALGEDLQARD